MAGASASFDILYLLPHPLDGALEIDADTRQVDVGRLRAERIGLAIELLAEKIEFAPDGIVGPGILEQVARLGDVRRQPVEFLAYIGFADQQGDLLGETLLRERRSALQQF